MLYTLTLDGIPVGHVDLDGAPRAVGLLVPVASFEASGLRTIAKRVGIALRAFASPRVPGSVAARALIVSLVHAGQVQDRLGLVDAWAGHAAIVHVLVTEFPKDRQPVVVAELREQAAPRGAERREIGIDPGARSRPAA